MFVDVDPMVADSDLNSLASSNGKLFFSINDGAA